MYALGEFLNKKGKILKNYFCSSLKRKGYCVWDISIVRHCLLKGRTIVVICAE